METRIKSYPLECWPWSSMQPQAQRPRRHDSPTHPPPRSTKSPTTIFFAGATAVPPIDLFSGHATPGNYARAIRTALTTGISTIFARTARRGLILLPASINLSFWQSSDRLISFRPSTQFTRRSSTLFAGARPGEIHPRPKSGSLFSRCESTNGNAGRLSLPAGKISIIDLGCEFNLQTARRPCAAMARSFRNWKEFSGAAGMHQSDLGTDGSIAPAGYAGILLKRMEETVDW